MRSNSSPPKACEHYATAWLEAAWGLGDDPEFAVHRKTCPRCQEALSAAREFVARAAAPTPDPMPDGITRDLAETVFARTTRRRTAPARGRWVWAGVAAGLATAGAAFLALRAPSRPADTDAMDLAEMDLELLESLELAENLEILEVLEALEELDDV